MVVLLQTTCEGLGGRPGLSTLHNTKPLLKKTNGFLSVDFDRQFPLSDRLVIYDLGMNS